MSTASRIIFRGTSSPSLSRPLRLDMESIAFSYTFHSLIVLSMVERKQYTRRNMYLCTSTREDAVRRGLQLFAYTICGEKHAVLIAPLQPFDLVDLFFNLQTLQIIEFWLVALKFCIENKLGRRAGALRLRKRGAWSVTPILGTICTHSHTCWSCSKSTIRPPLSPVARNSPV